MVTGDNREHVAVDSVTREGEKKDGDVRIGCCRCNVGQSCRW